MRNVCRFALALSVLALAVPVLAQGTPPSGSYQRTCTAISMSGTTLNATCNQRGGTPVKTTLGNAAGCIGDVANVDGTLACTGANGSFAATCKDISITGKTLQAQCKNKKGEYVRTSLPNFAGFDHNISNCDGKLQDSACS